MYGGRGGGTNENFYVSILVFCRMLVFMRVIRVDVEHCKIIIIIIIIIIINTRKQGYN